MEWLVEQILTLIGLGILLLLAMAVLAPLESLGWWAGWTGKTSHLDDFDEEIKQLSSNQQPPPEKEHYVVYLSGVGVVSADGLSYDEIDFINQLTAVMPDAQIITDVFPYSVNNNPLTGQRALAPLWRWVRSIQIKNPDSLIVLALLNIRNMLQVTVSADPRYGPIYSLGIAHEIARSLARHGYRLGSRKPVFLVGYSGGGQVSVGSASYLSPLIDAPVHILSIGGIIADDPGMRHIKHLTYFFGTRDPFQKLGGILWPGRWPIMKQSAWNQAKANGKIDFVDMGPMAHNAYGGYYDVRVSLPNGNNYCTATTDAIKNAVLIAGSQETEE